ncbi:Ferrochelatase-2 [Hibiscus syriacus]|uniref:Ferrochelatase-2 n=1 Tax=Hibiscus syriacus TaxID=106335 RepID=A0A6A2YJT0_HIBSY|nr:Ferrochelatase-2 [Hibiscus syriacus]
MIHSQGQHIVLCIFWVLIKGLYLVFVKSIPRRRYIASASRNFSVVLNDVDKPSSKPLIISSSDSNTQDRSVLKGRNLSNGPIQKRNLNLQTNCAVGVCTFPENVAESHFSHAAEEKLGVLLLNLGGPETLNDVQPFLYNLFANPDIIRLPRLLRFLQGPLAKLISVLRAPKSKEGYAAIGGGSPLRKITDEQIKRDRITKLVVLPLYPQFSISTTGEDAYLSRLPVSVILSWYQRQVPMGYQSAMLRTLMDPYKDQMEECIYLIMKELKARCIGNDRTLAYQSRVGPVQWLKPYTDEVLVEIGQKGVKSLLAVPV